MNNLTIYKNFTFEASHILPRHFGKCSRLHGHSWKLTVGVSGPVNEETGFIIDYGMLSELVKSYIINVCDHQHLGKGTIKHLESNLGGGANYPAVLGEEFYPSSENLVLAFVKILSPLIQELGSPALLSKDLQRVLTPASHQLAYLSLDETCTCKAEWRKNA